MAKRAEGENEAPADPGLGQVSFTEAMVRLEAILRRIENEEADIDRLADELQQAAALLEVCRAKIKRAEVEVSQILERLDE